MSPRYFSLTIQYFIFSLLVLACAQINKVYSATPECKNNLVLSTTSNWFPYIYKSENQLYEGFDLALLRDILNEMGCNLMVVQYPERRSLFEISQGRFDIGLGASKNKDRIKLHHYSSPYRHEVNRFAYRNNDIDIAQTKSLQDIIKLNKNIAINLAGWYGEELEGAKADYNNFIFSDSITKRLKMLYYARVDIVVDDELVLCNELERSIYKGMTIHPQILYDTSIHFIFNKKNISSQFVVQFNGILERKRNDGSLAEYFHGKGTNNCLS